MIALVALLAGGSVWVLLGEPPRRTVVARAPAPRWLPLVPGVGVVVGLLVVVGPVGSAAVAVVSVFVRRGWQRRIRSRSEAAERAGAVEALALLGSELRAGRSPADAVLVAAGVASGGFATSLQVAARSIALGADPVSALRTGTSAADQARRGLAACLEVCASSGSSLALAVETVAESMRADQSQRLAIEAELAGPRATALMLACLPVAGTLLAAGLGARPLHVLLHTVVGAGCLAGGIALDLLGLWWTERLVAAAA